MDFIFGILGIAQITFLPGLILCKFLRFQSNLLDRVLAIFGTSLIANYCAVFLLSVLGIYTRLTLSVAILGELVAAFWLFRNDLKVSGQKLLEDTQTGINEIILFFFPQGQKDNASIFRYFIGIILFLLSARSFLWAVGIFVQNLGTVFSSWDAVISWNSWATMWAGNQIPINTRFYGQLIPANWSISYVLLGSTTIQFFAKSIMPLFTLMMLVGLFNLASQTRKHYFLISLVILQLLLKSFIDNGLYNGYVDIALAFFTFAAVYFLLQAYETTDLEQRIPLYILGGICSAGAAVTKQPGVYIAIGYPILALVVIIGSGASFEKRQLRALLLWFVIISTIWVSWYSFKEVQILTGADQAGVDTYISLTAQTYESTNLFQQIMTAIGQHRQLVILFILIALTFPWMDRFYKTLTVLFAPYPFLWAWMAAYDTRNLAMFLPILALISGYSLGKLLDTLVEMSKRTKVSQTPAYILMSLFFLALIGLNFIISPEKLLRRQVDLQKQIFSPIKNQLLYDLVAENGPQTRILTNYPMSYLPELKQYQVRFNFQDYNLFLNYAENPEIEYFLFPNGVDRKIQDYIDAEINAGNYQVILKDKQWKVFTLVKIINR